MKQSNHKTISSSAFTASKNAFGNLFILLVILLMVLPFITTFNELLTRIVENTPIFKFMERTIVPYEVVLVRTVISWFGIYTEPGTVAVVKGDINYGTYIAWNCIGWQSLVILVLSLKSGLVSGFTKVSRIEVLIFALLGTFLINIARISAILILLYYFGKNPAWFFHNYLSIVVTTLWLFFFWWFSYKFILEEKHTDVQK